MLGPWDPGTQERVINNREAVNQRIKNACSWDETVIRLPFNRMLVVGVEGRHFMKLEMHRRFGMCAQVCFTRPQTQILSLMASQCLKTTQAEWIRFPIASFLLELVT
jgi:hypothetical protein